MSALYDQIGASYEPVKLLPIVRYGERHTLGRLLVDVRARNVLDIPCGTGFYARECMRLGARQVVGVDVSTEMISVARGMAEQDQYGIEYQVHDALRLPLLGNFDISIAIWLFNYASNEYDLRTMFERITENLTDDGFIIGVTMDSSYRDGLDSRKYGVSLKFLEAVEGGRKWSCTLHPSGGDITFETFMLDKKCYERAAAAAGLSIEWIPIEISQDGIDAFATGFWQDAIDNPLMIAFRATRN
ncbi:class I SAM-dependent methyltransferase [Streptomyces sp. KM273126]|uniref:class I SAM-dependent methyltransferase n=1 Tax=Streptomyces sp. KM273126 TaxID=2545247 RepID=UPI00103D5268|nr:class I SAM-dependent methyltransferase [Streptomyces sp. KM273126]MBA2810233.1 class I SAM-dependent methyltransferase [Streptomyces sp. KM273126]